jgi:hypothetical protein
MSFQDNRRNSTFDSTELPRTSNFDGSSALEGASEVFSWYGRMSYRTALFVVGYDPAYSYLPSYLTTLSRSLSPPTEQPPSRSQQNSPGSSPQVRLPAPAAPASIPGHFPQPYRLSNHLINLSPVKDGRCRVCRV